MMTQSQGISQAQLEQILHEINVQGKEQEAQLEASIKSNFELGNSLGKETLKNTERYTSSLYDRIEEVASDDKCFTITGFFSNKPSPYEAALNIYSKLNECK